MPPDMARPPDGIRLHHTDAACLVVDKPAGLLSVPGRGPDKQDCAASRVQAACADAAASDDFGAAIAEPSVALTPAVSPASGDRRQRR